MLKRLRTITRSTTRRLAMAPLRVVGKRMRAEALEQLSNTMVTDTPIPGGVLRFFALTPLLQDRAASTRMAVFRLS
ncbi:MAG: hypothetical protein HY650_13490 [Acidobacteria bacterium]|nr:hypothetical protein [Acidobacteriota bacterium]